MEIVSRRMVVLLLLVCLSSHALWWCGRTKEERKTRNQGLDIPFAATHKTLSGCCYGLLMPHWDSSGVLSCSVRHHHHDECSVHECKWMGVIKKRSVLCFIGHPSVVVLLPKELLQVVVCSNSCYSSSSSIKVTLGTSIRLSGCQVKASIQLHNPSS